MGKHLIIINYLCGYGYRKEDRINQKKSWRDS
jgi:hypothetical protein